jgi:hypothetical protein
VAVEHVLNWLWQGCVVALATSLTLRLLQRSRANARYALCWIALVVLIALPVVPSTGLAGPAFAPVVAGAPIVAVPTTWWTSTAIVMTLWAIWTAVCAVRLVRGLLAMRRLIASSRAFPASLESRLINWNRVRTRRRQHVSYSPAGCARPPSWAADRRSSPWRRRCFSG